MVSAFFQIGQIAALRLAEFQKKQYRRRPEKGGRQAVR
jgi:hypothetical protein